MGESARVLTSIPTRRETPSPARTSSNRSSQCRSTPTIPRVRSRRAAPHCCTKRTAKNTNPPAHSHAMVSNSIVLGWGDAGSTLGSTRPSPISATTPPPPASGHITPMKVSTSHAAHSSIDTHQTMYRLFAPRSLSITNAATEPISALCQSECSTAIPIAVVICSISPEPPFMTHPRRDHRASCGSGPTPRHWSHACSAPAAPGCPASR